MASRLGVPILQTLLLSPPPPAVRPTSHWSKGSDTATEASQDVISIRLFPQTSAGPRTVTSLGALFKYGSNDHNTGERQERRAFSEDREVRELGCFQEKGGGPGLIPASLLTWVGRQISGAAVSPMGKFWPSQQPELQLRRTGGEAPGTGVTMLREPPCFVAKPRGSGGELCNRQAGNWFTLTSRCCWEERKSPRAECAKA